MFVSRISCCRRTRETRKWSSLRARTRPVCEIAPISARTSLGAGLGCFVSPTDGEIRNSYCAVSSSGVFDVAAASAGDGGQAAGRWI
jgi:hypothetical protein